jgi:hypothetical protein
MRVLAAAFPNAPAARSALDELRGRFGPAGVDSSTAPLGNGDPSGSRTVLAGRFPDEAVPEISAIVAHHGGQVVSDVDERWTRSPTTHESLESDGDRRAL